MTAEVREVGLLQQQLDDVRAALRQARELIGVPVAAPPGDIQADPVEQWVR